jgi:hypothetical protein
VNSLNENISEKYQNYENYSSENSIYINDLEEIHKLLKNYTPEKRRMIYIFLKLKHV